MGGGEDACLYFCPRGGFLPGHAATLSSRPGDLGLQETSLVDHVS